MIRLQYPAIVNLSIEEAEDPSLIPVFSSKLTTLTVDHTSQSDFKEQIKLPEVTNPDNLMKIELLEDPTCKEVKAAYNSDKHTIGVTVTEVPSVEKQCSLVILVISKGKSTVTY